MTRTEGYLFKGSIIDYDENLNKSFPVPGETISLFLGSDKSIQKHFSATTDSDGKFTISVLVPLSFPLGVNNINLMFGATDKYDNGSYTYDCIIKSKPIITIQSNTTISKGKEYSITFILTEDNGKIPIKKAFLQISIDGIHQVKLITDHLGYATYTDTFPSDAEKVHISASYSGSPNEYYEEAQAEKVLTYSSSEDESDYITAFAQYWILLIGIIVIIIISLMWLRWRKRHIPEVKDLLLELMSKLETSDKTRRIIYDAYLKLLNILQRYGFIRKDSETPREFENAVQEALPKVNAKHLDSLTGLFEEARYSRHRLGKPERMRAVRNLRFVRRSLETQ
jgi:hypothetical protein